MTSMNSTINTEALDLRKTRTRSVLAATVGNAFQFYDFFLYATSSALIFDSLFFPSSNAALGTMAAFASYAVGFASRPFGAIVFGHVGDRFGRKVSLTWTLCLMGLATFSIGLLPTYRQIGIGAPIMLGLLRILQGFAAGGEWGGGMLMATENAPEGRRGYYGAWSQAGVGLGFIISAGVFYLTRLTTSGAFLVWGWRVPFLFSVVVVAAGLVIRARVPETEEYRHVQETATDKHPIRDVLRLHWRTLLVAGGLLIAEMTGPLLTTAFALAYGKSLGIGSDILLAGVILSMVADMGGMLFFGRLSDTFGRVKVYAFGVISLAVCIYPFFLLLGSHSTFVAIAAFVLINGICHAAMIGTQPALLTELFPVQVRSSGLALAQSVAVVFVGFIPLAASTALYATKSILSVVAMTFALCAISLIALWFAARKLRPDAEAGRSEIDPLAFAAVQQERPVV